MLAFLKSTVGDERAKISALHWALSYLISRQRLDERPLGEQA